MTVILVTLIVVGPVGYFVLFKRRRAQVFQRLLRDFGLTHRENGVTWKALTHADLLPPYAVREITGLVHGKNVIVRDVLASDGLAAIGLVNPFFQVTTLEVDGQKQELEINLKTFSLNLLTSAIVAPYSVIAETLKSI